MTLNQFLRKLRRTPRNWHVYNGIIRCSKSTCPIHAVARVIGANRPDDLGRRIGLRETTIDSIISAADNSMHTRHEVDVRKRLLKACGLAK